MQNGSFKKQEGSKSSIELHVLKKHRNGYYNLPCKHLEINKFLENNSVKINGKIYDKSSNLHIAAKPSKTGGVAYVYLNDLD